MSQLSHNLQAEIVAKSWKDEAFKQELLNNPNAALKALGVEVPSNIELQIVEETANKVYLVLPVKPSALASRELNSEQLETVAGGRKSVSTINGTVEGVTKCCW